MTKYIVLLFSFQIMDERIRKVIDKDRKRRDTIYEIYTDIEDVLQMDVNLRRVLTTEFDDETKDLEKLRLTLIRPECPILVLGIFYFNISYRASHLF